MKINLLTMMVAVAGSLVAAQTGAAPLKRTIAGFKNPESVLMVGGRRFVSNIGEKLDPLAHDGDGFISELDVNGAVMNERAFPPPGVSLDAPKGMASLGGRLYVTDIDRIVGFDLATRAQVFEAHIPGDEPAFLNDLVVVDGALIVSDSARGAVYRVNVDTTMFTEQTREVPGANGLAWDERRESLLVVGMGANFGGGDLFEVSPRGEIRAFKQGPHGMLDGLAVLTDGRLVISDWRQFDPPTEGEVTVRAADGAFIKKIELGAPTLGPADFAIDEGRGEIWLPVMRQGIVVIGDVN